MQEESFEKFEVLKKFEDLMKESVLKSWKGLEKPSDPIISPRRALPGAFYVQSVTIGDKEQVVSEFAPKDSNPGRL